MSMINPSIDQLVTLVDSKYTLVTLAAKRAREILDEDRVASIGDARKPVSIALQEIAKGKISYERVKPAVK